VSWVLLLALLPASWVMCELRDSARCAAPRPGTKVAATILLVDWARFTAVPAIARGAGLRPAHCLRSKLSLAGKEPS